MEELLERNPVLNVSNAKAHQGCEDILEGLMVLSFLQKLAFQLLILMRKLNICT
jgi:hypothetical protein